MTTLELLTTLHTLGIVLTPTCTYGDVPPGAKASGRPLVFGLHVDAPKGVLTDAVRAALREHKQELLDLVEEWSERAAIAEYCGGVPRADAEALAWHSLVEQEALEVSTP